MPVIEVHLIEGYTPEAHRRLGEAITDATRLVVPAPAEAITVMIQELDQTRYFRGRGLRNPAPALPDPCAVVVQFLSCLQERNLEAAKVLLDNRFQMSFPGMQPMHCLEDLVEWASTRYRTIAKHIERTEAFGDAEGKTIVYCSGMLSGEWPDGRPFNNIRFVDRFELVAGLITRQEVWNDLAEVRAQAHA